MSPKGKPYLAPRLRTLGLISASLFGFSWAYAGAHDATVLPANIASEEFNVEAGLPHNGAPNVLQTKDGYLWVGTEAGLARFDGIRFTVFRNSSHPTLGDNQIRVLHETEDGVLYVATSTTLCHYDPGSDNFIRDWDTPSSITFLANNGPGSILVGTVEHGPMLCQNKSISPLSSLEGLPTSKNVRALLKDSKGRTWIGYWDAGLYVSDGTHFTRWKTNELQPKGIIDLLEHPAGTIWAACEKGLLRIEDEGYSLLGPNEGLSKSPIRTLQRDRAGRIWVISDQLNYLNTPGEKQLRLLNTPPEVLPRSLVHDAEDSFWIGTTGDGLLRMRVSGFEQIPLTPLRSSERIRTVTTNAQGGVWVGHPNYELVRVGSDDQVLPIATQQGEAWTVCEARDGRLWIGTRDSLSVRDRNGLVQVFSEYKRVRAIFEDAGGDIWIG